MNKKIRLFPDFEKKHSPRFSDYTNLKYEKYYDLFKNQSAENRFLQVESKSSNDQVPAAYTYLGQLLIHEITFTLSNQRHFNALSHETTEYRSAFIDLDAVYGRGPLVDYYFYDQEKYEGRLLLFIPGYDTKINSNDSDRLKDFSTLFPLDLPRTEQGTPLIPDKRNDENIIIRQLHLALMCLHNTIAIDLLEKDQDYQEFIRKKQQLLELDNDTISTLEESTQLSMLFTREEMDLLDAQIGNDQSAAERKELFIRAFQIKSRKKNLSIFERIFKQAKKEVLFIFQWVILMDFFPKIAGNEAFLRLKEKIYAGKPSTTPRTIPIEFSSAAGRFGHAMVRSRYEFAYLSGRNRINLTNPSPPFSKKSNQFVNWSTFTGKNKNPDGTRKQDHQASGELSPLIVSPMTNELPTLESLSKNIVFRNLMRGAEDNIPNGQYIAEQINGAPVINYQKLNHSTEGRKLLRHIIKNLPLPKSIPSIEEHLAMICNRTPLWLYILIEAKFCPEGKHLGPVGAHIFEETLHRVFNVEAFTEMRTYIESKSLSKPLSTIVQQGSFSPLEDKHQRGDDSLVALFRAAGVYCGALAEKSHTP